MTIITLGEYEVRLHYGQFYLYRSNGRYVQVFWTRKPSLSKVRRTIKQLD